MKSAAIVLLLLARVYAHGQPMSAAETVKSYSIAQKRLLVVSTAQFANIISQNNLDKDSIMKMACRITGLPFLLPYNEGFPDKVSGGDDFINTGKITEAIRMLNNKEGEEKIQLLVELGIWYLHQPGNHKEDLDSADVYIEAASRQIAVVNYSQWANECRFLMAELNGQRGNTSENKSILVQIASSAQKDGDIKAMARSYYRLGELLPKSDSVKLVYCQKSFELYKQLDLKEKEIEVLQYISCCRVNIHLNLMERDVRQVLSLMQSAGFRHVLFEKNLLSFALVNQTKYIDALKYANDAIENLNWSGITAVEGAFYYRMGGTLESLGKNEDALQWFLKAVATGTNQTHLFWYKSLFYAHTLLIQMERPSESLSMINNATAKSPPVTLWESMQVLSCKGQCYEKLNKPQSANENYMSLLEMANSNPSADPNGELSFTYLDIASFYTSRKDLKKARLFLKQGLVNLDDDPYTNSNKYSLLFKIDSLEKNYESALHNHILFKLYYDSVTSMDQRKKINELIIKDLSEKKDQDIRLLKEQGIVQKAELRHYKLTRNIMITGTALLLIIVGLIFNQYNLKQRANIAMNTRNGVLQKLLDEKEWLLNEVHHRVKNNLHTVISLLESQAAYLEDDALKAIENSQQRIYAMSLIHQELYRTEDVKTIDMAVYIPEFIRYLEDSFEALGQIRFLLNIEPLKLGVGQAIPVALIINEAVTNAIKYAFPQKDYGAIKLSMRKDANDIFLSIADNGIGMVVSPGEGQLESLGLKLIKGLTEDINGRLDIIVENGTSIHIQFPVDPLPGYQILNPNIQKDV